MSKPAVDSNAGALLQAISPAAGPTTAFSLLINPEQLPEPLPSRFSGFIHITLPYQPCFSQALKFRRKREK